MTTPEAPRGEELMQVYGALVDLVTVKERARLDQMMRHVDVVGGGTPGGVLDVLPTLPYIVERLTVLAGRYSVEIPELTDEERAEARARFVEAARSGS